MNPPKVLIAEDDPVILSLMVRRLSRKGYDIDQAEEGRSALIMVEKTTYDLIVTDIYMPGVTGLELLRWAREHDPHTQVVVVTAAATLDNAVDALNNGAFAYLTKPFDHISVLDKVVERALEFRRLVLDNLKMAEIQRIRGDMLEEEVTDRVQRLQESRREIDEILALIPDGVVIVEGRGRVVLSNPPADKWLEEELASGENQLQRFIESVHDEWSEDSLEVSIGSQNFHVSSVDLPPVREGLAQRKLIVIHPYESRSVGGTKSRPDDLLLKLKHGLAWVYQQNQQEDLKEVLEYLANQVNKLENLDVETENVSVPERSTIDARIDG